MLSTDAARVAPRCIAGHGSMLALELLLLCHSCRSALALTDSAHFFGDVNAHRAPRDAAPAPHAARSAKLVNPAGQLVRHPLAIACLRGGADTAPINIGKIHGVARVPLA